MAAEEKLHVNYYVGAVLAQGGEVRLEESKIVFSPTSAIDRAMGATDVEIPFDLIQAVIHKGDMSRTVQVKTDKKVHKFEGKQVRGLATLLQKAFKDSGLNIKFETKQEASSIPACPRCTRNLRSDYAFCPYCSAPVKLVCSSCRHAIERDWVACAFCGINLNKSNT